MMHWMDGGYYMGYGWIFWLVLIGVLVWAIITIVNKNQGRIQNSQPVESAADILKKRFAKGEITKEQYAEMNNTLRE